MKTIFYIKSIAISLLVISSSLTVSCKSDECCEYGETADPCIPFEPNSENAGFTVATYRSKESNNNVGVIFDTRLNSQAPVGEDWSSVTPASNQVPSFYPANWNARSIGEIFGIAIDAEENIYLAESNIYLTGATTNPTPGQIYKCVGPTYTAVPFVTLSNTGNGSFNGLGNIAYDKVNNQLFATNIEDGNIYRIPLPSGSPITQYDPWNADASGSTVAPQDEQVWGIGVNYESGNVKVYFPRVTTGNATREMYSITLQGDGSFPALTSETVEISNIPGTQMKISDIAFNSDGKKMLIAERGENHSSKVVSYNLGTSWSYNVQYFVGSLAGLDGENSAGGVDFAYTEVNGDLSAECDSYFWATGNWMFTSSSFLAYGMEGIDYSGNNSSGDPVPTNNSSTDLFVDFDGISGNNFDKGNIGDVEVFDASECFDLCNFQ